MVELLKCHDGPFISFIVGLLQLDPEKRLSPMEALLHPFFSPCFPFSLLKPYLSSTACASSAVTDFSKSGSARKKEVMHLNGSSNEDDKGLGMRIDSHHSYKRAKLSAYDGGRTGSSNNYYYSKVIPSRRDDVSNEVYHGGNYMSVGGIYSPLLTEAD